MQVCPTCPWRAVTTMPASQTLAMIHLDMWTDLGFPANSTCLSGLHTFKTCPACSTKKHDYVRRKLLFRKHFFLHNTLLTNPICWEPPGVTKRGPYATHLQLRLKIDTSRETQSCAKKLCVQSKSCGHVFQPQKCMNEKMHFLRKKQDFAFNCKSWIVHETSEVLV